TRLLLCLPAPISRQPNEPEAISPVTDHRRRQSHYSRTANWFTCLNDVRSKAATPTRLPANSRRHLRNIVRQDLQNVSGLTRFNPVNPETSTKSCLTISQAP